jgi:hypothetical protein
LLDQELPLHFKPALRSRRNKIASEMVTLGLVHGWVELDKHLSGLDNLSVMNTNRLAPN